MSGRLERRYRRLLAAYPADYRAAHGDEIVGTLLEAAPPTQRFPAPREAAGLLFGGLRTRARQAAAASPPRLWSDGLQLGVLLIVLANLRQALGLTLAPWIVLVGLGVLAVLRGWVRTALVATTLAAVVVARPFLPPLELPWWLPGYGDWSAVARYAVPAVVLAVLARPGAARLRPRSWWWLLVPVALAVLPPADQPWVVTAKAALEVGFLAAVLVVAVGARDPRPAVALAVFLTPGLLFAAEEAAAGTLGPRALAWWTAVALLVVALAAVAWWTSRAQHSDH